MHIIKKLLAFALIIMCNFSYASSNPCPIDLVIFWQKFANNYGAHTVPAFLIKNGCIQGPHQVISTYELYQRLLAYENTGTYVFAPNLSYEELDYLQTYAPALQEETEKAETNFSTNYEIDTPLIHASNPIDVDAELTTPQSPQKPIVIKQHSIIILFIEKAGAKLYTIFFFLALTAIVLYFKFRKNNKTLTNECVTCKDCGSSVPAHKEQCFICGSYV